MHTWDCNYTEYLSILPTSVKQVWGYRRAAFSIHATGGRFDVRELAVFFWQMVISFGDFRYLPHAIIVHSMWVITWIIISLPLLITSYQWHGVRA
jgi:hypothetical protein